MHRDRTLLQRPAVLFSPLPFRQISCLSVGSICSTCLSCRPPKLESNRWGPRDTLHQSLSWGWTSETVWSAACMQNKKEDRCNSRSSWFILVWGSGVLEDREVTLFKSELLSTANMYYTSSGYVKQLLSQAKHACIIVDTAHCAVHLCAHHCSFLQSTRLCVWRVESLSCRVQ